MYLNYYELTLKPFEISPDPKFLWLGEKHMEAFAALKYGILKNKGFMCLTGDVGTGKTTIVNALASRLKDNIIFAQISDPCLEELDFFNLTADVLNMNKCFSSKGDFLGHLRQFLNKAYANNKEVVLIIEEAQQLNPELLEQIRLLSNIERPDKKLINILFVGQLEFNSILNQNAALRQRISILYTIEPLMEVEIEKYVTHRLKVAGSSERIFSQDAIHELFSFSKGNPRLINTICDLALLTGYVKELKIIGPEIISECAANFQLSKHSDEGIIEDQKASANALVEKMSGKERPNPARRKIAYMLTAAAIILACVFGFFYYFGDYHAFSMKAKPFLEKAINNLTSSKSDTSLQKADEAAKHQGDITAPPVRQLDLKAPKAGEENQDRQLKIRNEELDAARKALESMKVRISVLETEVAQREQMLSQSTQKSTALEKEIVRLKDQLLDLDAQKASAETQLRLLNTEHEKSQADLRELASAKARIIELESAAVEREQKISQAEQKITTLSQDLDQEKENNDLIRNELSSKNSLMAELQKKLAASESKALKLEDENQKRVQEISRLKGRLANLTNLKDSAETRLGLLNSEYDQLQTDLRELQRAKARIIELENAAVQQGQKQSLAEQKLVELAQDLDREIERKGAIEAELASKVARVAQLQEQLEIVQSKVFTSEGAYEDSAEEIADLQGQLLNLKAQATSSETQLGQLQSRNTELVAELKQLQNAQERIAQLESTVVQKERQLNASEQKFTELTKNLAQEIESKDAIQAELASKVARVGQLQEQLESVQSKVLKSEGAYEHSAKETADLQGQLVNLKAQAASNEAQLGQMRSRNNELVLELKQLQRTRERIAQLESAIVQKEQELNASEQKLTELAKNLAQEKENNDLIQNELSSKNSLMAEFQTKLAASESKAIELEDEIQKKQTEIAELQGQLANLKSQQTAPKPSPRIVETPEELPTESGPIETEAEPPNPGDIIDWIIKKKSE